MIWRIKYCITTILGNSRSSGKFPDFIEILHITIFKNILSYYYFYHYILVHNFNPFERQREL